MTALGASRKAGLVMLLPVYNLLLWRRWLLFLGIPLVPYVPHSHLDILNHPWPCWCQPPGSSITQAFWLTSPSRPPLTPQANHDAFMST